MWQPLQCFRVPQMVSEAHKMIAAFLKKARRFHQAQFPKSLFWDFFLVLMYTSGKSLNNLKPFFYEAIQDAIVKGVSMKTALLCNNRKSGMAVCSGNKSEGVAR